MHIANSQALESTVGSKIGSKYSVNDNINLANQSTGNVSSIVISPVASATLKEMDWNASFNAEYVDRKFSGSKPDSDDMLLKAFGNYQFERNIFSADLNIVKHSSLNQESDDFGVTSETVERTTTTLSPGYTRLLTERTTLFLGLTVKDVEFNRDDLNLVPYGLDINTASLSYALSERASVSGMLQLTNYESDDSTVEFDSMITRASLSYRFSRRLAGNFSYGKSRRDSIQRVPRQFSFFNTVVTTVLEDNSSADGTVYSVSLTQEHEGGSSAFSVSRDDRVDSYGGVSVYDTITILYTQGLTELLDFSVNTNYSKSVAIASEVFFSDREALVFQPKITYKLDNDWDINVTYRYAKRKFLSTVQGVGESNSITVGAEYRFPTIVSH